MCGVSYVKGDFEMPVPLVNKCCALYLAHLDNTAGVFELYRARRLSIECTCVWRHNILYDVNNL